MLPEADGRAVQLPGSLVRGDVSAPGRAAAEVRFCSSNGMIWCENVSRALFFGFLVLCRLFVGWLLLMFRSPLDSYSCTFPCWNDGLACQSGQDIVCLHTRVRTLANIFLS